MKKTRQYNDLIDCIGLLYIKNETELLWSIRWGTVYDRDQIGQWRDWLGAIYAEIRIELLWQIKQNAVNHENQTGL